MELIKVKTTKKGTKIVSARDLYIGLGLNKAHWKRWAKMNIEDNVFLEKMRIGLGHHNGER